MSDVDRTGLMRRVLERTTDLARRIANRWGRRITVMEVCGTHTTAFARSGLTRHLAEVVELRSGPGCPVCVTHQREMDQLIALAEREGVVTVTFGDLLRVPGSKSSLERAKARGARVHICYSPLEALSVASRHAHDQVVLPGIGFETTAPIIACTVLQARQLGADNFSVYTMMKLVPPALHALLREQTFKLDGLILPGHVSAVLGRRAFDFIASEYGLPAMVTGFGEAELLAGLYQLLKLIDTDVASTGNAYPQVVREEGNKTARDLLERCFDTADSLWRGLGEIPDSGYRLKRELRAFEARERFALDLPPAEPATACRCGDVICGRSTPFDCPLFNRECTPTQPIGPCMVSSEGACSAYFQHLQELV